jgi:hypothetical protein
MHTTLDAPKPFDLCTEIATETDPLRRTEAIAYMRRAIAREQQAPHSPEDQSYLRMVEMILDFIEEKFEPSSCAIPNCIPHKTCQ